MIKYDRIISNHNKLCKRFNIDRVVRESVFTSSMVSDCVIELCKLVDTYTIPISAKYSICLGKFIICNLIKMEFLIIEKIL